MKILYGLAIALTAVSTVCGQYGPLKGSATRRTTTPFPPGFKSDNEIYNGPGSGYSDNSLDAPNAGSSFPGAKGPTTPSSSGFQKGSSVSDYVPPSLFGASGFPSPGSFMQPNNPWLNRVLSNGGVGTGPNFTVNGFAPDTLTVFNNPFLSRVFSDGNAQLGPFGSPEDCNVPGFGCVLKYQCQNGQTSQPESGSKKCDLNTEVCCKLSGTPSEGKPGYPGSPGTAGQSIPTFGPNDFSGHSDLNRPFKQPAHGKQPPNQFGQSNIPDSSINKHPSKDHGGFSKSTTQSNYANSISHPESPGTTTLHKQPSYDKSSGFPKSTKKPGFVDTTPYPGFTEKFPQFGYTSSLSSSSVTGQSTPSSQPDSSSYQTSFGQQNQPSNTRSPGSTGQSYRPGNLGSPTYTGSTGLPITSNRPGFPNYPESSNSPGQPSQSGSSQYPGSPGQPGQPSQSGSTQYPGSPGQPGQPSQSGSPQYPGSPGQPGQPSPTGFPQYPGSPGQPGQPSQSGSSHYPGSPGQSGQPSYTGSSQRPGSSGQPGQPSPTGFPQYPGSPGSSTPSSRPGFPNYPGSPGQTGQPSNTGSSQRPGSSGQVGQPSQSGQANQPSYGGSTPYPGSTGLSGPSGRPGFPKYPGSSGQTHQPSYPGSVGQTYQPGKYGSPSYSGSTSKPPQFGYNSLSNVPGSNGAPISGSIYDNLSGFQYGANNVTESPNGPYTGPLNTTPHVGCPAALKCVEETYCTWDGIMSDTPVVLTKEQAENRVPLSECQNIETGIIGKCCRDPNYEDPWPSDVTHGEGHFGDHGHDHSGHPDKEHNHNHHPNHRDQQGINLITCGSSEICTPQDQCTGGRHVNSVKRCSLHKGDSTGVCCKRQSNTQGSSSQITVTPSASNRQPPSLGLRPQQPKNPFLSNELNKPEVSGQGGKKPVSSNNNLFTDTFSNSYPTSGTSVGTPSPKGNVHSNTAQNSLENFTDKPSSPGQFRPYSESSKDYSKPAFSVTTDLSSQTVRPTIFGGSTVRPGQTIFSTTPGLSSNVDYTGYTGSSDRPKQPGFSTSGLSTQSNRNTPFGTTSLPNRVNQPQGPGDTQLTGQQRPNNFIASSTTSRGESGYYSFTTASPYTPSDLKYTGSTPKPNEPSSFERGQANTFYTSTPQSYSNKPGGSLSSPVQPGLSQFGLNSSPSGKPDITLHTVFLGSTLPSGPTQNLDLLKNTQKPTFSITTQSPNESGGTKYEYVYEQSSQTIQPGLISTTPSPISGNDFRGSTSQTILSTGAPTQHPSNNPLSISGQGFSPAPNELGFGVQGTAQSNAIPENGKFSPSLPTANQLPGTFSSTTAFPSSSSFGDSPHLRPSFPIDSKRTPDRAPSVFGFNSGIYNSPATPSGRPKGPPPGFPFSQSPTVKPFKSTVSYEAGKSCGIRGQVERPNGPNGLETGFGEFPWQAQVLRSSDQSGLCNGAIISDKAVITSAYCLNDLKSDDLMVKVGDWKLGIENPSEEPKSVQIRFVAAIVKHPKYDPVSRFYDMAVLLMDEPFALDSHVGVLCVGDALYDNQLSNLNNCVVSGWKKQNLKETTKGSVLKSIPVNFVEPQQCENTLQSTFLGKFFQLHRAFTCIRPVEGQHRLCEVDTGSPIACQKPDGRYELAGIYSWDVGCPPSSDAPAVTTNIDKTWVKDALQKPIDVAKKEEEDERERLQTLGFNPNESDLTKPGFSQGYGR